MGISIEYPEPTVFSCETTVRITDLSTAGHLGFDHLVAIINDASARFFAQRNIHRKQGGVGAIYADLMVRYLAEAFFGDILGIEIAIGEVREKGLDLVFRITRGRTGVVVAIAKIGVLFFDYDQRKVVPIPAEFDMNPTV
ncbi:acyl-CoA thioesterase [Desulfatirhabdium butyrativorans]|uniref:acyl-CoA thioesterase n=1 Tax=Desulfatirhabdium butyrativorans TaxID=340467 RepID=UPI0003F52858|nr:thioesterase family protein [Desulfatirhabdium butyrativorans]